jgi:hypothetical protein
MSLTQTAVVSTPKKPKLPSLNLLRSPASTDPRQALRCRLDLKNPDLFPPFSTAESANHSYLSISAASASDSEDPKKHEYSAKYKTEICKNFQLTGKCKFGPRCCFAHGLEELRQKTQLGLSYKLKVCKNYHELGYCKYGQRCQYVHLKEGELFSDILQTAQNKIARTLLERRDEPLDAILRQTNALPSNLPVFQQILRRAGVA